MALKEKKTARSDLWFRGLTARKKPKRREVSTFISDMAKALEHSVAYTDAIKASATIAVTPVFRGVLGEFHVLLKKGIGVGDAMSRFPFAFGDDLIAVVRAAEASGESAPIYRQLADRLRKQDSIMRKIGGSVAYNGMMAVLTLAVAAFLGVYVFPKMIGGYGLDPGDLPAYLYVPIQALMFCTRNPIGIALSLALLAAPIIGWNSIIHSRWVQTRIMMIPTLGEFLRKYFFVRAFSIYSLLLSAGVNPAAQYTLSGKASGSIVFQRFFEDAYKHVADGKLPPESFMLEKDQIGKDGDIFANRLALAAKSASVADLVDEMVHDTEQDLRALAEELPRWLDAAMSAILTGIVGGLSALMILTNLMLSYLLTK